MKAKNRLGIIFFPAYDWAISETHPEREERLLYTQDQLREEGVFDIENILEVRPDVAGVGDITRTHFCFPDVSRVAGDSHMIAAGGAIRAMRLVMDGQTDKAFALIRPPGHHAMKVVHGNRGFCNINNEAVMIEAMRELYGPRRIAIVDTDCHHGDGTQDIYWHDPDVLYISVHQDGRTLYPGSGFPRELGGPNAVGRTINIPLPPGTADEGWLYVLDHVIMPILDDFKPDVVVNSAGQDNHYSDPITHMNITAQGYATLNRRLDPDLCVLEGGYSVHGALPYVNLGIILAMAGLDTSHVREPDAPPAARRSPGGASEYIRELSDAVRELYFRPPADLYPDLEPGAMSGRRKNIYYDTDAILENQFESVRVCEQCAGVRRIETESTVHPLSLAVEIPFGACRECAELGRQMAEDGGKSKKFHSIQLIDRFRDSL